MNRFINVRSRLLGEDPLSYRAGRAAVMSRRPVAMTLHKPVIYGPAIEASQAFAAVSCFPSRVVIPPFQHDLGLLVRRPFRDLLGSIELVTYLRSIAMTTLHKPERATYCQAIEAQHNEHVFVRCDGPGAFTCLGNTGDLTCCYGEHG